jgi:uncharacterized protein
MLLPMKINDRIYGQSEITDSVIIELIHSRPIMRLQKINQAGASQYLYSWKDVTRYEHSIGVMLLLRKYQASLSEQISGLLHDVPHTAFSHVIDFVFENEQHEFHELFHEKVLEESEIYQILEKYHIPKTVVHPENFSLLERNIPDLCADRIDYALRDFFIWKQDTEFIKAVLSGIDILDGEFIFKNIYSAEAFALNYLEVDNNSWANPRESALYVILAQAIRHAMDKKILTLKDMFTDDENVFKILQTKGDMYIQKKLSFMTPSFRVEKATKSHYHLFVKTKIRYIDPKVLIDRKLYRLSEISKKYNEILIKHQKNGINGWYLFFYKE